ncbi:MAG: hypothetical protein OEM82_15825 [Acidobacteriota bacterium]|nr:hypothetical protein [Acidobacteriota bacterium]MDH3528525.1 hypothetical protein [Acidobacteriota bacterium]
MRITNIILLGSITVFILGCGFIGEKAGEEPPADPTTSAETPKHSVGDTVVAKWTTNSFYEGEIESIDGSKITVKWEDGSNPTKVDDSDVFALPKSGAKPEVEVGDIVLAKTGSGSYWNGAEVTKIDGDAYEVKTVESGATSNVSGAKIITVPDAVAANLKQKAGSTEFAKEAHAKKPEAPAGFKPEKGEQVLAEWSTNSWWAGKVEKSGGTKTTVAWDDGSKPSEVDTAKVIPFPTAKDSKMPEADQYLLIKPSSGSKWIYAQVTAVGDTDVDVKTGTGESRKVKAGEFVLLN